MKRMIRWMGVAALSVATLAAGQEATYSKNPADYHSAAYLQTEAAKLLAQAKASPGGSATLSMEKYPGHFMNLTVRVKSGGGELHGNWSDVFVAVDGEAEVMVGGTLENRQEKANGEAAGSGVVGGTVYVMHKGDVIHISPNVPHQTMVPAGKTFTYFVVKAAAR